MSPTDTGSTTATSGNQQPAMSEMRRRRESQAARRAADGAAGRAADGAAGRAADGAAGRAADGAASTAETPLPAAEPSPAAIPMPSTPVTETQIVGQELVLASEALVPLIASRVERTPERNQSQTEIRTPVTRREDRFLTPAPENSHVPNGIEGTQESDRQLAIQRSSVEEVQSGPCGPPMSLGPPVQTPPSQMLPLFTPEQTLQLQRMEEQSPWLYQRVRQPPLGLMAPPMGMASGDLLPVQPRPGLDAALQELQDQRASEAMWKAQVEQMMSQMGLQLRASQLENVKLREELRTLKEKPSSSFHTPEDGPRGQQAQVNKEDGPRGQQGEESKEDGPRGQQGVDFKEDGLVSQQEKREEILKAQEEMIRSRELYEAATQRPQGGVGLPPWSEVPGGREVEDGSEDQQESSEEEFVQVEPAERPRRASRGQDSQAKTLDVMLKLMVGMQEMQKSLLSEGTNRRTEDAEFVRGAAELFKLPEWQQETSPIDFNDWVLCLHAHMSDLSATSQEWWEETLQVARSWVKTTWL